MPKMAADRPNAEAAFAEVYSARFAEFHLAWSVFFVGHLADLRARFDDLEDALLLVAFGIGPVAAKRRAAKASGDQAALVLTEIPTGDGRTNASRLSAVTGIPRETVRRKLEVFRQRGWVEQDADRSWRIATCAEGRAGVVRDMGAAHAEFIGRLARLMAEFDRIRDR